MPKSARNRSDKNPTRQDAGQSFIPVDKKAFDPNLASLFASSLGPVKAPSKSRYQNLPERRPAEDSSEDEAENDEDGAESADSDDEELSEVDEEHEEEEAADSEDSAEGNDSASEQSQSDHDEALAAIRESVLNGEQDRPNKKRKRANKEEEVEDVYMRKLAREELKEEEERKKKQKTDTAQGVDASDSSDGSDGESYTIPKHETQLESGDADELEKAARTVFLGNVSSEAIISKSAKKELLRHLGSFIDDMADHKPPHKVESLRFRSTAFASALPKKAAFAKKEVMDSTTKSTNAYAVYSTKLAAKEAAKRLNGTTVLKRHLLVDSLAHPSQTDHRRCVFVGNLAFVDDESQENKEDGEKKKKNRPPGDVEEGLWVQFSKAGKVESVRVPRDAKTRVSKGFAYVQYENENSVEAALQFNDQKFPPLLPRKLRVVRAKAPKTKSKKPEPFSAKAKSPNGKGAYKAKVTNEQRTHQGRAKAMLGKAAAASLKTPESFVFEGHRASSKQGKGVLKKAKGKKGKLANRSSKRAAAWKKTGGKQ